MGVNWSGILKSAKQTKKDTKNKLQMYEFFKNFPEKGYMRDNISKNMILITEAKSSSLRRYIKLLDNFFYLIDSENSRNKLLEKKVEIETELSKRDDGIRG